MGKNLSKIILIVCIFLSIFFNFYKQNDVPGCLNADEAAFGYNAYSILKTGRDEFGAFLPLRLQSFNDFKLPLYSYLSIPFIAFGGLDIFSTRLLNKLIGILFVPLVYLVVYEISKKKKIALIASFLTAISPWIMILSRQAHEGVLSAFFVLLAVYFIIKFENGFEIRSLLFANGSLILSAFSYHTGRIFLVGLVLYQSWLFLKRFKDEKKTQLMRFGAVVLILTFMTPFLIDGLYGANRVKSLLFFQRSGFQQQLDEYLNEHPNRIMHNKGTASIQDVTIRYLSQFSTDFFIRFGDTNPRFGFERLSLITPVEYIFLLIGLYYLFKHNAKFKGLILLLILITPLGNALTWQENSLARTYFLIFPIIFVVAYGAYSFYKQKTHPNIKIFLLISTSFMFLFYLVNTWDLYLNHYFKRALVTRAWQCGYKDLTTYINNRYENFDKVYITKKHGQPYIFLLFFNQFPPDSYWLSATKSEPDEYGFTQVEGFDKFIFDMPQDLRQEKIVVIGYPDDFQDANLNGDKIHKVMYGHEEMFWIYQE